MANQNPNQDQEKTQRKSGNRQEEAPKKGGAKHSTEDQKKNMSGTEMDKGMEGSERGFESGNRAQSQRKSSSSSDKDNAGNKKRH